MKRPNIDDYNDGHEYYYTLSSYWKAMFNAMAEEVYGVRPHDVGNTSTTTYLQVVDKFEDEI